MSGILAIADVHIGDHSWCRGHVHAGISDRAREGLDALAHAVQLAQQLDVEALVVLGDLFDVARPTPPLVRAVQSILEHGPRAIVLVGNHDQESQAPGHHACAPLLPVAKVVDAPELVQLPSFELALLPPRPSVSAVEGTACDLLALQNIADPHRLRVLGLHLGIADDSTPTHLREAQDAIRAGEVAALAEQHGVGLVMAGNWHWPAAWKSRACEVVQVGTLAPHDFRDAGQAGCAVHVQPSGRWERYEIPGPRFMRVSLDEYLGAYPEGPPERVYVQIRHRRDQPVPSHPRVQSVLVDVGEETASEGPAVSHDPSDVEPVLVAHVRDQLSPDLVAAGEQAVLELWRRP